MAQEKESRSITDILSIQRLCTDILGRLETGKDFDMIQLKEQLLQLLRFDLDELQQIQEEFGEEDLIAHCRAILIDVRKALRELESKKKISPQQAHELVQRILLVENYDLTKVTNFERFEPVVQKEFFRLLEASTLRKSDMESFLRKIKGYVSTKAFKKIERALKEKIEEEEVFDRGPVCKEKELEYLAIRITEFFRSPYARDIPKGQKITFYLGGSLVAGYGTNQGSKFYKKPTDFGRLSDVDILVLVDHELWTEITRHMDRKQILSVHGIERTLPVGMDTPKGPESTGPFAGLFQYLQGITLAGRRDRPVHCTFVLDKLLAKARIHTGPHKRILTITT